MAQSLNKVSNVDRLSYFEGEFLKVKATADDFLGHDRRNEGFRYLALQSVFDFGEKIRKEVDVLNEFIAAHDLPINKVTQENPYNALIHLAFPDAKGKAWLSKCSTVLAYAHELKLDVPFREWLEAQGGISECYDKAALHFKRRGTGKAGRKRALRLERTREKLLAAPLSNLAPDVDLGISTPGFYRSLVYFDGATSKLVHVKDIPDDAATEAYLLDLFGHDVLPSTADEQKPLYELYRALDLIVSCCGDLASADDRQILIWNEKSGDRERTELAVVSGAYTFVAARAALRNALGQFRGRGRWLLSYADAVAFCRGFQLDEGWSLNDDGSAVLLQNDAASRTTIAMKQLADQDPSRPLRVGSRLLRRSKSFQITVENMDRLLVNTRHVVDMLRKRSAKSGEKLQLSRQYRASIDGLELVLAMPEAEQIRAPFAQFSQSNVTLHSHRAFARSEIERMCEAFIRYGDDVGGSFVDADEKDAAFQIEHEFANGDRFELTLPMVISDSMARVQVCEELVIEKRPKVQLLPKPQPPQKVEPQRKRSNPHASTLITRWKKTNFPTVPYSSGRVFGAFISSFLPDDPSHRSDRKFDFECQLEWWRRMTDMPVTVVASNWTDAEVNGSIELQALKDRGGEIIRAPAQGITLNRNRCLTALYESQYDWGVIMDDDACLMHSDEHNSGAALFSEIAANDPAQYDEIDIFYPFTGKHPSHGPTWQKSPELFDENHVFDPAYDLKGSLFVVRNFQKFGRPEIFAPADYGLHSEDILLGTVAVSMGASVYRCNNMVLREFSVGASHFPERDTGMQAGHQAIAELFKKDGLRLKSGSLKAFDRTEFLRFHERLNDKRIAIPKPLGG